MTDKELQKANAARWETLPPVHPAALLFPMMSDDEIDDLAADIKKNGLRESAVLWEDNSEQKNGAQGPFPLFLLDGRNHVEALRRLGDGDYIKPDHGFCRKSVTTVRVVRAIVQEFSLTLGGGASASKGKWVTSVDPWEYVWSVNFHRRHLTLEAKRNAIARYIKERPQASNRKIAKTLKVSDHTVADVRKESGGSNAQDANLSHLPLERAKAAVRENPSASANEIAKIADVGRATAQRAQKLIAAESKQPTTTSAEPEPTPSVQRQSEADLVNEWLAKTWKTHGNKTMIPDLFIDFIMRVLAKPITDNDVLFDALEAFDPE